MNDSMAAAQARMPMNAPLLREVGVEYRDQVSKTHREVRSTLHNVIEKLKDPASRYYERYGPWAKRHPELEESCWKCVRPAVWEFLDGKWCVDRVRAIGGNVNHQCPGVYFNCVIGLDKKVRIHIGQANNIHARIGNHGYFRYRRDNPSFHYYALEKSTSNLIGTIVELPSFCFSDLRLRRSDCPELFVNILELWMALVFRSLPRSTLTEWLPCDLEMGDAFGPLNLENPLDQGGRSRSLVDLTDSEDPLMFEYLLEESRKGDKYAKRQLEAARQRLIWGSRGEQIAIFTSTQTIMLCGTAFLAGLLVMRNPSIWLKSRSGG